jgi:hypothetical protein
MISKTAREVSPNGYSDAYGPNVANILAHGSRTIRGPIPARVRADLRAAVKDGVLGHMPKDGLKPEIFFHPAHRGSAMEVRAREALYAVDCIRKVIE